MSAPSLLHGVLGKQVVRISHRLELQTVATGVLEEHRPLRVKPQQLSYKMLFE